MTDLYHYTSLKALFGIIESGVIHLGQSEMMNDPEEYSYGGRLLKEYVKENHIDLYREFKKDLGLYSLEYDGAYLLSLTSLEDDVSQWRQYGDNGYGISIKFNSSISNNFTSLLVNKKGYQGNAPELFYSDYGPCIYDRKEQIKIIKDRLNNMEPLIENKAFIFSEFDLYSRIFFKQEAYKGESEYRIFVSRFPTSPIEFNNQISDVSYKMGYYGITEYVSLPIFKQEKILIDEICIGPKVNRENILNIKKMIYKSHHIDVNVKPSLTKMR
ncbi:DUF2971 domain-containing protein [Celerinatantimonas sp. YJH-8]|uniref:DUF2971 domain-containing protein n=1 Tax=Celerinatantimonas sp. YJH-8 TaxID=3228714 RepID=UPI0038C41F0C